MWQRLSAWLLFGLVFSLLPIAFDFLHHVDGHTDHGLPTLIGRGQLLLISVVIAGSVAGELILAEVPAGYKLHKIWASGSLILMLVLQAAWYSDILAQSASDALLARTVAKGSLAGFAITIFASVSSLYLTSGVAE